MWILPDQKVIRYPRAVTIDGIQHPKEIFRYWTPDELANIGIKTYVEEKYDTEFYKISGEATVEIEGVILKYYQVTEDRYTIIELRGMIDDKVKEQLRVSYERIQKEKDFLNEFDSESLFLFELETYKNELIAAYATIQADIMKIANYEELSKYTWDHRYPFSPFEIGV